MPQSDWFSRRSGQAVPQHVRDYVSRISFVLPLAVMCCAQIACATRHVELTSARLAGDKGESLVIEVGSSEDLAALSNSRWAGELTLRYSVDGSKPAEDKYNEYDPALLSCRKPFFAQLLGGEAPGSKLVSRWRIPFENKMRGGGLTFSYSLRDGARHVIAFEVYGASMSGRHVRSNELTISVQLPE